MVKKVVWRKKAIQSFGAAYDYLIENYSVQAAENFAKSVDSKIDFLIKHPESGRKSTIKPIRFTGIEKIVIYSI